MPVSVAGGVGEPAAIRTRRSAARRERHEIDVRAGQPRGERRFRAAVRRRPNTPVLILRPGRPACDRTPVIVVGNVKQLV